MSDAPNNVQSQLAKLKTKYAAALPGKLASVESALAPLFAQPWSEEACATSHRQIHSLAGSAGTYGFGEITTIARDVEALLKQSLDSRSTLSGSDQARVADLMKKLHERAADASREASR